MKHLLTILSGLLVALLFARCADDDNLSGGIDGLPERGIVIRLSTGELDTRTQLTSTGDYHHVEEVWAVLYKWNGNESTDPNDPNNHGNYYFESATRLNLEDGSPWNPYDASTQSRPSRDQYPSDEAYNTALDGYLEDMQTNYGGEYGNGKVQGREFVLPETNDMTNGTYRVLCIGFDEISKTVYGLRSTGDKLSDIFTDGETLADAYATISATDKTRFQGELFAGWQEFEFERDNLNNVEVEMKRRVAGVLCYVTDIPREIAGKGQVKGIRLVLNTQANDKVHLCRKEKPNEDFGTYTDTPASKTVLDWFDLSDFIDNDPTSTGGSETFNDVSFGQSFSDGTTLDKGRLVLSAYLLPVEAPASGYTLSVELLGGDDGITEGDLVDLNTTKVLTTFNATRNLAEEEGLTDEEKEELGRQESCYNILPNYIYHIGNRNGSDIDEPMSLLGQKITVVPQRWTEMEIPVEFPGVPIFATMELWTKNDYDEYEEDYIFDCVGITDEKEDFGSVEFTHDRVDYECTSFYPVSDRIRLRVKTSLLKSYWKITMDRADMLYIRQPDDTYKAEYDPADKSVWETNQTLDMILTDYVNPNAGTEPREVTIYLQTYDENDKNGNPIHTETIVVRQYNAIFVTVDNQKLGFSHYDWSSDRTLNETGETAIWNYWSSGTIAVFGVDNGTLQEDGRYNYNQAKNRPYENMRYNFYVQSGGSAMYKAGKPKVEVNNGSQTKNGDVYWFLPAIDEAKGFFEQAKEKGGYNLKPNEKYWTSSPIGSSAYNSRNIYFDDNGNVETDGDSQSQTDGPGYRQNAYYLRQCCRID